MKHQSSAANQSSVKITTTPQLTTHHCNFWICVMAKPAQGVHNIHLELWIRLVSNNSVLTRKRKPRFNKERSIFTFGLDIHRRPRAKGTARRMFCSPYCSTRSRERIAISRPNSSDIATIAIPRTAGPWWISPFSRCSPHWARRSWTWTMNCQQLKYKATNYVIQPPEHLVRYLKDIPGSSIRTGKKCHITILSDFLIECLWNLRGSLHTFLLDIGTSWHW